MNQQKPKSPPSLKQKMVSGLFWSGIERFGQQGIQFAITIIIARILTPADYGLIGMLAIFVGVAQSLIDSGFGSALIQKQDATQTDFSTIFFFNLIVSTILFFILFFSAPLIAEFYNQSLLTPITKVMALNLVINSLGLIQNTVLTKRIDFKTLTKISMISVVVSGSIGIFMACTGFGVWSLVFQILGGNIMKTMALWLFNKWRPTLVFSFSSLKSLFSYGSKLLASGILNRIFDNVYKLVIGKIYTPTSLGFYTQAKRIQEIPVMNSLAILQRVTFPAYSTIQHDTKRLKNAYRKTIKAIVLINFPLMIGILVCAQPLVKVLLTDKWIPVVPYLQLMCMIGIFYPLSAVNLNILKVRGRTDIFFRLEITKKILIALAILITYRYGIYVMIFGQVCTSFVAHFLNIFYSGRLINYSIREQIEDIAAYLILAVGVGAVVYVGTILLNSTPILIRLIIQIVAFAVFYVILVHVFGLEAYKDLKSVMNSKFLNIQHNQAGATI